MKVTAFIGSARKKHTYDATEKLLQKLQSFGNVEYEIVPLSDYNLGTCKGCKLCFDKGEEFCQFKDDRDKLIEKILISDGVIFSSPNYSFNVSALMKVYLDRLGFLFHRPRFFGKAFTCIVAQGIFRGGKIVKYFNFIGNGLGFNVVHGCCIRSLEPMTEKGQKKINKIIDKLSKRFYSILVQKEWPTPSYLSLWHSECHGRA
jgi:multimeric flavodoxin WrbA